MNWHRVIVSLQKRAAEQLTDAKEHANRGDIQLASAGLIAATVAIDLADALREGLRDEREPIWGTDARPGSEDDLKL